MQNLDELSTMKKEKNQKKLNNFRMTNADIQSRLNEKNAVLS